MQGRRPRFIPGPGYDRLLARADMLPPVLGGRSKKDQLGSWAESWGQPVHLTPIGLNQHEEDPPSRSTSPFKTDEPFRIDEPVGPSRTVGPDVSMTTTHVRPSRANTIPDRSVAHHSLEDISPVIPDLLTAHMEALRLARRGTAYEGLEGRGSRRDRYSTLMTRSQMSRWRAGSEATTSSTGHTDPTSRGQSAGWDPVTRGEDDEDERLFAGSQFRQGTDDTAPIYAYRVKRYESDAGRHSRGDMTSTVPPPAPVIVFKNVPEASPPPYDRTAKAVTTPLDAPYAQSRYSGGTSVQRAPSSLALGDYPIWSQMNDDFSADIPTSHWAASTAVPAVRGHLEETAFRIPFGEPSYAVNLAPLHFAPSLAPSSNLSAATPIAVSDRVPDFAPGFARRGGDRQQYRTHQERAAQSDDDGLSLTGHRF